MTDFLVDWPAVERAAAAFHLALPRTPMGGRLGQRLGAGSGSSIEFQDYRAYAPGDDLRHVDWAAFARSDTLTVRLYRDEVAPRIDLVLDASRSMIINEQKARAHRELAALLACAALASEADTRLLASATHEPQPLQRARDVENWLGCDGAASILEQSHLPLRRCSLRVVLSDFLFPHDADALINRLARDGAALAIVQLTLPEEAEPVVEGPCRLTDAENGGTLDLVLNEETVSDYRERFSRLRLGLSRAARRAGAAFAHVKAGAPLRELAVMLTRAGILEAAWF